MAPWLFTSAILKGEPIRVFNNGEMQRDFTFVDDIVSGVLGAVKRIIEQPEQTAPVYNLGNNRPVMLSDFISEIEKHVASKRSANLNRCQLPTFRAPMLILHLLRAILVSALKPRSMKVFLCLLSGFAAIMERDERT